MKFSEIRPRFNTLFGRLVVLIMVVLVLSHFSWLDVLRAERHGRQFQASIDQIAFQLQAFQTAMDSHLRVKLPDLVAEATDPPAGDTSLASDKSAELVRQLACHLPSDTQLRLEAGPTLCVFVHSPQRNKWTATPLVWVYAPLTISTVVSGVIVVLAITIVFSPFAAWQIQRPVRELADTTGALVHRRYIPPLKERGPYELRQLTEQFNHTAADLSATNEERNTMLAGTAYDLKTPLLRLCLCTEMLIDQKAGAGIEHDVESMSAIVKQFLAYARSGDSEAREVLVDRHPRSLVQSFVEQGKHVALDLHAEDCFHLKPAHLEHVMANLLDNAFAYGAEPVNVCTSADETDYTLTVKDHGAGIPVANFDRVIWPFVRLDPAHGGSAHYGLDSAIADYLARHLGGDLAVGPTAADTPSPGFRVIMRSPVSTAAA